MATVRVRTDRQWSLEAIAKELLPEGEVRKQFLRTAGKGDETRATFDVDPAAFGRHLQFHIYILSNGVRVTAPVSRIGDGVVIEDAGDERRILVKGLVVDEKLSRRA